MKIYIEHNEALYPVDTELLATAVEITNFAYVDMDSAEFDICNGNEIYLKRQPELMLHHEDFIEDIEDSLKVIALREAAKRNQ